MLQDVEAGRRTEIDTLNVPLPSLAQGAAFTPRPTTPSLRR
ncbi:MAG: ketopantoate reductase C-terminal domain-containing protein [Cypionkella sp.]